MDTEYTKGFKSGLAWEQERIIKLLVDSTDHACDCCLDRAVNDAIELIKGETNE